jgi:hypothetical protein
MELILRSSGETLGRILERILGGIWTGIGAGNWGVEENIKLSWGSYV